MLISWMVSPCIPQVFTNTVGFVIVSTVDWPLNHLSLYKCTFSDIVIVQHPVSVYVPLNYKVTLSVRAEGTGILNYQWFKSSKEEVCVLCCQQGERLTLSCTAFGIPTPHYQWYRNGLPLLGKTTDTLQVTPSDHRGTYLCYVSNVQEERWTEAADVEIATDKVALLIGNLNYSHHPDLMAPTMDVHELANLLQQLGFRVVSLLDLTREEMLAAIDKFLLLLDRGVYALFYYAGHGYERLGRNYLVAIDAPQPYRSENCVCVQRVMCKMQERRTALNVVLLDTCRTCTGIFTKYLNKHILQLEKVTHILELVSENLGRDPFVIGKQAVEIRHTLKEPRSLTDPIRTTGHTGELHLRDACRRQANELPHQKLLIFNCGVEVEVSFSALFSNVMVAFGRPQTLWPSKASGRFTMSGTPYLICAIICLEMYKFNLYYVFFSLPVVKGSLVIKVDLHYTHMDRKLWLQESKQLDIGKPLVASCDLHRGQQAMVSQRRDGAPAQSMGHSRISHSKQRPRQTLGQPGRPFTKSAECAAKVPTARSNEPGENDETEPH
uniref:Uncharacterized protein n=1 Tax=Oncorhynchus tshawytscha TaxID=74940 RepID=A0A8C8JGR5_ONCTS